MDDEWWYESTIPYAYARFVLNEGITAFAADIVIWNRKTYFHKPRLCSGDGPIPSIRRWFRQFYNAHSYQLPPLPPRQYDITSWQQLQDAQPQPQPQPANKRDTDGDVPLVAKPLVPLRA